MDDAEHRRVERDFYPRPPEDVIDEAILRGFRKPEGQTWIRGDDLHEERPRPFQKVLDDYAQYAKEYCLRMKEVAR